MIKAMCRLSCSECDKTGEDQPNDGSKRRGRFRNIEQLKGHLFHRHKLFMCSLCLEGRKVCTYSFEDACGRLDIEIHSRLLLVYSCDAAT